jgi:hypothetical protein
VKGMDGVFAGLRARTLRYVRDNSNKIQGRIRVSPRYAPAQDGKTLRGSTALTIQLLINPAHGRLCGNRILNDDDGSTQSSLQERM